MKYLVEAHASMERGNAIDANGGPAPLFAHIVERFQPEALYGNPTRRQVFLIVDLETATDVAELMYLFTWSTGNEPVFTPIMAPQGFGPAIENAMKGPAMGRPWESA